MQLPMEYVDLLDTVSTSSTEEPLYENTPTASYNTSQQYDDVTTQPFRYDL